MGFLDRIFSHDDLVLLDDNQRRELCGEVRRFLVENVSKTGGHLASNLGVVELSVALETVFDTRRDRLVFDVGHQSYVHKLLTGRRDGFENLRGAYLAAMKEHFPFTGDMPDSLFWSVPQYNTWIELGTNQTAEGIKNYAKGILEHGLPAGVLMIDGGWQEDYGVYEEFHRGKVPDPEFLVDELHKLGFKVMLWVSPIIASAGTRYKFLRDKNYLVRNSNGEIAIRKWWSGYSAVLDFTNPDAVGWMEEQ